MLTKQPYSNLNRLTSRRFASLAFPAVGFPCGRRVGCLEWSGDSRAQWEGDTLVVETTNFLRETALDGSSANPRFHEGNHSMETALNGVRALDQ